MKRSYEKYLAWKKRSKPIKKRSKKSRRTKDGRVILGSIEYTQLRLEKSEAARGRCEDCGASAPFFTGEIPPWAGQLAHWPPKKMGNSQGSDTPETTKWLCSGCHDKLDGRNQKAVPSKSAAGLQEVGE